MGLAIAFIPLESVAEVASGGGAARYCHALDTPYVGRGDPKNTMLNCTDGRPDYLPAVPLEVFGGLITAIGLVGTIVRIVEIRL